MTGTNPNINSDQVSYETGLHQPSSKDEASNNGSPDHRSTPDLSDFDFWTCITVLLGIGCLVATILWTIIFSADGLTGPSNISGWFNWHPILMLFGLVIVQGHSILVFRILRNELKPRLKALHASLHFLAFGVVVWGVKCAFDSHNHGTHASPNLQSLHSWIGFGTVILFGLQFVGGFTSFLFPGLRATMRAKVLPLHVTFGTIIFFFSVCAAFSGFTMKGGWGDGKQLASTAAILMLLFAVSVFHLLLRPEYKRKPLRSD